MLPRSRDRWTVRIHPSPPAETALVATFALTVAVVVALSAGTLPISSLITPGGLGPAAGVIEADFGPDAVRPDHTGYDGQQVYAIARELPDLRAAARHLDRPAYRMLRILPPLIASPAPPGAPTVLALLGVNVAAFGIAVFAGGRLLQRVGVHPMYATPAAGVLLLGVASTGVEPLAWALTLLGLDLALDGRHRRAIALLVLAALSRETAAVASVCIGLGLLLRGRSVRISGSYLLPGAAVVAWYVAVSRVVDGTIPSRFDLLGLRELTTTHSLIAGVVALLGVWGVIGWRDHLPIALCSLAFTAWMLAYTADVLDPIALIRVNGLAIVLGGLGIARTLAPARHGEALT